MTNQPKPLQPLSVPQTKSKQLCDSPEAIDQLSALLAQSFDSMNTFGSSPDQLSNKLKLFSMVLADFSIEQIRAAFVLHAKRSSTMPTPSDIFKIIKRGNKPQLDQSFYIALCQKRERTKFTDQGRVYDCLTTEEIQYIKDYENDAMGK